MTHPLHKPFDVFLDLDGVFADFDGAIKKLTGFHPRELPKKELWKTVYRKPDFFATLDLMHGWEILWSYFEPYDPIFLTGAPSGKSMQDQKIVWVGEKFGPKWAGKTVVLPRRDKQLHSGPRKLLLDDNQTNVAEWVSKGGYGILYKGDPHATISEVEELRIAITTS